MNRGAVARIAARNARDKLRAMRPIPGPQNLSRSSPILEPAQDSARFREKIKTAFEFFICGVGSPWLPGPRSHNYLIYNDF